LSGESVIRAVRPNCDNSSLKKKGKNYDGEDGCRNSSLFIKRQKHAAPTELDEGPVGVGGYRHGAPTELEGSRGVVGYKDDAPTELFKSVHGCNACAERKEAFYETCVLRGDAENCLSKRQRTAALHDLAEGVACTPSRQSRSRGRVRLSYADLTLDRWRAGFQKAPNLRLLTSAAT